MRTDELARRVGAPVQIAVVWALVLAAVAMLPANASASAEAAARATRSTRLASPPRPA